ncbi:hypothetical protein Tco_0923573 [Tanacetum coccineum]|uniref:Uncharacterized protein n=1 Tax=Tanacetum coccineum TaxID=301880 RepID=A0ABQ5D2A8_9ASTR
MAHDGQQWQMTVNGNKSSLTTAVHRSTTDQRWLTASQRMGQGATWIHVSATCVHVSCHVAEELIARMATAGLELMTFRTNIVNVEFVGASLKLILSGSRNGDVISDEVMLRSKETTIGRIIKRV